MVFILFQGLAGGDRGILWLRSRIHRQLRWLGTILDTHAGKFIFVSMLAIATFSTGVDPEIDLLHPHGLLEHLVLIQKATQVTVTMYGMGTHIKWTNLNPSELIAQIEQKENQFDYHTLRDYLKRAGITTGYQEKPCLNPRDPECPTSAPNFNSSMSLDIGAELTSGCYGFAAKYMHWPEDLIVGGVLKNKSGHIKEAKALQTVVQLMSGHELYEYWSGHYKVHHVGWTKDKATLVLNTWQKRFAEEIERLSINKKQSSSYIFLTFSTANVNKILEEYSKADLVKCGIVLGAVCVYGWIAHSGIAVVGVLVLASSAAAALGVCSLIGLPMNLLSTHVLPYITVGLAMRDMFLILTTSMRKLTPSEVRN
nr:unnamed protein product [Callosobruchus analis]